ncbi:caspase family protein [Candidatus Binatia bacterium]|nr:caspase family protein [Candidatus Binatia bacterium]
MAKAHAVCIGLNSVDPKHYQGWSGDLLACEADAEDMLAIAKAKKFKKTTLLLTTSATRKRVVAAIESAARSLVSGDLFLLTYSGHGGQLPDKNDDEPDHQDETWCLYDGELVDDELYVLWSKFKPGVRVLVFSDSCHSGTVTRALLRESALRTGTIAPIARARRGGAATRAPMPAPVIDPAATRYRAMPDETAQVVYRRNKAFYDGVLKAIPANPPKPKATVRLISGCQDNQLSQDGTFNGLFTGTLLKVWKDGAFTGNYAKFHRAIVDRMPSDQTPKHFVIGAPNHPYDAEIPFTV